MNDNLNDIGNVIILKNNIYVESKWPEISQFYINQSFRNSV